MAQPNKETTVRSERLATYSPGWMFLCWLAILFGIRCSSVAAETNTLHWSFRPVVRSVPPANTTQWKVRNPIDNFVFARLAAAKLSPSPEASRRILIRRLYYDLTGLPPSPEAVQRFETDKDPDAYENLVDRLLGSPQYGERWAQHWLDVVRFAESHGFEMNQPRPNAWKYRDYVIASFNRDKPYNQFVREQFAGDVLGEDAATGFLVAGAWDQVKSPDPVLSASQRADELHDMVSTTGSAFLGMTVGCARCHDHKFDPIPQVDYYAIKACLAGVEHGEREVLTADSASRAQETDVAKVRLQEIEAQLADFEPIAKTYFEAKPPEHLRAPVNARRNVDRFAPVTALWLRFTIENTTDAQPGIDELEVFTSGPHSTNVALASFGTKAKASGTLPNFEIHKLEHVNDGLYGNSHSWISDEPGKGWIELNFPREVTIDRVVWSRDREQKYSDRLAVEYRIDVGVASNKSVEVATSQDRLPYQAAQTSSVSSVGVNVTPEAVVRIKQLLKEKEDLETRLKELANIPRAYAGIFTNNAPTYRLQRGDAMQKREVVEAGGLSVIPVMFKWAPVPTHIEHISEGQTKSQNQLPSAERERRLALADWIIHPDNPLPARVIVNRLWQHHFGQGIVSTPSDFGKKGAAPSHPELLDWLASELTKPLTRASKGEPTLAPWGLKHIQRLIVTSSTYRQESEARENYARLDAGSRLLWRFPPQRLEAEQLRDSILFVSGKLVLRSGGPGFSGFEANDNYVRVYKPKQQFGSEEWRRMIYMTKIRMQPEPVFGAFDCPDGGQVAPARTRSTTPLQALNLMNSSFMLQQAEFFAERLVREVGSDTDAQVRHAYSLAFNREPDEQELAAARSFVSGQSLTPFCRAIFNSNEFVFVD